MCQFASRLLYVGFGQVGEAGFDIGRIDPIDVAIDLPCICLSEGEAAITKREGEFHASILQTDLAHDPLIDQIGKCHPWLLVGSDHWQTRHVVV